MVWNDPSRKVVTGVFKSDKNVEKLLDKLEDKGFYDTDVSVVMSEATQKRYPELAKHSKAPEGATAGGVTGALTGAIIGGLTLVGSVVIPGAGLLVAGPIIGAITGGAVGATAGSLVGALIGAGIPEIEAKHYEEALKDEGTIFVMAHLQKDDVEEVRDFFQHHGAESTSVLLEDAAAFQ